MNLSIFPFILVIMFFPAFQDTTGVYYLDLDCFRCHSDEGWKPLKKAPEFSHDTTAFPLKGFHKNLKCTDCHKGSDITEMHRFGSIPAECWACHHDVHFGALGSDCEYCHDNYSWRISRSIEIHDKTRFPLVGKHRTIDCFECHLNQQLHQYDMTPDRCYECHYLKLNEALNIKPDHSTSTDCEICHQPTNWKDSGVFVHPAFNITSGNHKGIDCLECHLDESYSTYKCYIDCHFNDCQEFLKKEDHRSVSCPDQAEIQCYECHLSGKAED